MLIKNYFTSISSIKAKLSLHSRVIYFKEPEYLQPQKYIEEGPFCWIEKKLKKQKN